MKIDIDLIQVDEASRIRQDVGNISNLQRSIEEVGLVSPILVDEQYRLIAGYRRLRACKNLKWKEIEAHVIELEDDELRMLEAEAAENMYRVDFTPEEILAIHRRRQEIVESRRHKGFCERCWIWLKSLFAPKPAPAARPAAQAEPAPRPAEAEAEAKQAPAEKPEAEAPPEPPPGKAGHNAQERAPEPAAEPEQKAPAHIPRQPSSAEIVEKNGVRHIKWR